MKYGLSHAETRKRSPGSHTLICSSSRCRQTVACFMHTSTPARSIPRPLSPLRHPEPQPPGSRAGKPPRLHFAPTLIFKRNGGLRCVEGKEPSSPVWICWTAHEWGCHRPLMHTLEPLSLHLFILNTTALSKQLSTVAHAVHGRWHAVDESQNTGFDNTKMW